MASEAVELADLDGMLWRTAVFGKQVEDWLQSDIGDFLLQHAQAEADEAYQLLKVCAPWRRKRITDLQNRIWRAESFRDWLGNAVQAGRNATEQLEANNG